MITVLTILILASLRKNPFLLALRRWGRFARRNLFLRAKKCPAAKSEEKRMPEFRRLHSCLLP